MSGRNPAVPRGFATALLFIASTLIASTAFAQSDAETLAELRECARVDIDRARWNCFDGVFAQEGAALAGQPAAARGTVGPGADAAARSTPAASPEPAFRPSGRARRAPVDSQAEPETNWIVTVVEMTPRLRGNLRFVTADGEIYTQPYGEPKGSYPDVPFEAELETGAMGSYFIRPREKGPRTRVSLLE